MSLFNSAIFSSVKDRFNTSFIPSIDTPVGSPIDTAKKRINGLLDDMGRFVVAELGQSNMSGRDGDNPLHVILNGVAFEFTSSGLIHLTNDRGSAQGGSHATHFAQRVFEQSGRNPVMVDNSQGGTGSDIEAESASHWGENGNLFPAAINKVNAAMDLIGTTVPIGLWCQGERDAQELDDNDGTPYTREQLKENLQSVVDRWFAQYPDSIFLISELGTFGSLTANGFDIVRAVQNEIANDNERVFIGFNGAKSFASQGKMKDALHYNAAGYRDMGNGLADTLIGLIDLNLPVAA